VDITRPLLNTFIEQRRKDGASDAYINRNLALLHKMLSLLAEGQPALNVPKFPKLKEPDARKGFCTFAKLYTELPERLRTLVLFLYTTRCRKGEARKLDWSQLIGRRA